MKTRIERDDPLAWEVLPSTSRRGIDIDVPRPIIKAWNLIQRDWELMQDQISAVHDGALKSCPNCDEAWLSVCGQDLECPACHAAYTQDMKMIEGVQE